MDVQIEDISESVAALALQGPTSGRLLKTLVNRCRHRKPEVLSRYTGTIAGVPVEISRPATPAISVTKSGSPLIRR